MFRGLNQRAHTRLFCSIGVVERAPHAHQVSESRSTRHRLSEPRHKTSVCCDKRGTQDKRGATRQACVVTSVAHKTSVAPQDKRVSLQAWHTRQAWRHKTSVCRDKRGTQDKRGATRQACAVTSVAPQDKRVLAPCPHTLAHPRCTLHHTQLRQILPHIHTLQHTHCTLRHIHTCPSFNLWKCVTRSRLMLTVGGRWLAQSPLTPTRIGSVAPDSHRQDTHCFRQYIVAHTHTATSTHARCYEDSCREQHA